VRIADDNLYSYCNGCSTTACECYNYEDSCCLLDYELDFFESGQCSRFRRSVGDRTGNSTAPDATGDAARNTDSSKPDPGTPNGRKLQQAGPGAAAPTYGEDQSFANTAYDAGAANYGYDNGYYSGTYYTGEATVVWGTFYATNAHTGEKWEEEGEWCAQRGCALVGLTLFEIKVLHRLCAVPEFCRRSVGTPVLYQC
jgi:hypothetical protein